jgi:hypothetical protein
MRMREEHRRVLYWIVGVSVAFYVFFMWPQTSTWDGDGTINVFPDKTSVKNYRLDATMTVTKHKKGWLGKATYAYSDIQGQWPNGGTYDIQNCVIWKGQQSTCTDQDGRNYDVEVEVSPDQPEPDNYSSDYY